MSDIVERLRLLVPSDSSGAAFDAVTEITRLRNELHIAREWSARVIAGHEEDIREITSLRAENEKLRAENETILAANHDVMLHWDVLKADYERLRAALEPFAKLYLYPDDLGFEYAEDIRGDADWDEDANDMTQTDCFALRRDIRCARDILKENNK